LDGGRGGGGGWGGCGGGGGGGCRGVGGQSTVVRLFAGISSLTHHVGCHNEIAMIVCCGVATIRRIDQMSGPMGWQGFHFGSPRGVRAKSAMGWQRFVGSIKCQVSLVKELDI